MSRAFVRESDDRPELPVARPLSNLPPGTKNYLTPDGAERLREELQRLIEVVRPPLAAASDDADAKRQLATINGRIQQLEQSLQSAEIVHPPADSGEAVRFGAFVTVRRGGDEDQYRIVGVDEIDLDRGWVSWLSPIARALLNQPLGARVKFKFPSGEEDLEIVRISYDVVE